jgi:hypothetical protein
MIDGDRKAYERRGRDIRGPVKCTACLPGGHQQTDRKHTMRNWFSGACVGIGLLGALGKYK